MLTNSTTLLIASKCRWRPAESRETVTELRKPRQRGKW